MTSRHLYPKCTCGQDAYFHGYKGTDSYELCCADCYVKKYEKLGKICVDGGKCHHACGECEAYLTFCFRRKFCGPFSNYHGVWDY